MKKIIITTCFIVYAVAGIAQKDSTSIKEAVPNKLSFHSLNQIGILEGETGTRFQLQTVNGFQYNRWFAGIGTGIDYYAYRTIPLFLDVRRNFSDNRITPFIYIDGGTNFPWVQKGAENGWYNSTFKNGWYYDAGLGYTIQTKNSGGFVFSVGYSAKKLSEVRGNPVIYDFPVPGSVPVSTTHFNYQLRRISIKAGWKF